MADLRIGIVGCAGRMGRTLLAEVAATAGCALAGGIEAAGHPSLGRDLGELAGLDPLGLAVGDDPVSLFAAADAVIDFTAPASTLRHAGLAANARAVHVIGTTGLAADQEKQLELAAHHTAIVRAANMSVGVNLLLALTRELAAKLGPEYDIEIVEMHHRHKVDAPSGTALALGRAAAEGRNLDLAKARAAPRLGQTGPRKKGEIGFAVLRGGDVVGDHSVIFAADGERIELTHKASNRHVFARGAVRAALWARSKPPGLYSMADVLGTVGAAPTPDTARR